MTRYYVEEKKSLDEIAAIYGVKKSVINVYLTKFKIPRNRPDLVRRNTHKLHNELFVPTNPIANYLAGLVITDGYVTEQGVSIKLIKEDQPVLNALYQHFYQTEDIKPESRTVAKTEKLSMGSKEILKLMAHFGIVPGPKTFRMRCPQEFHSDECKLLFLRGVIDGDGCVYLNEKNTKYMFNVATASWTFAKDLRSVLETFGVKVYIQQRKTSAENPLYYVTVNGRAAFALLERIYEGHPELGLPRKRAVLERYKVYRATCPKPGNKNWDARGRFTFAPKKEL